MDLEALIWKQAAHVFGANLTQIISAALDVFKREPGLDDLNRMYESVIGRDAFAALAAAMLPGRGEESTPYDGIIEIRSRMRWHLRTHLLRKLVADGVATAQMRDSLFSSDLGL
ncbi:hypothetical protein [Pseudomonas syringae]|uniref:hypothetical protein n=1 Tax=Pseudomonas syringae TaxID=317 RepID=UPI0012660E90|nr:hypothetical protein [Pseudomonas syringae]